MNSEFKSPTSSRSVSTHTDMDIEGPNINVLPWEVLDEIFSHLDGNSLLICKRVCKLWREHVIQLEKKTNFWYENCQKEIPQWTQFDLLDNMFPSHWRNQSLVDWKEIYKCWSTWNSMLETPLNKRKLDTGLVGISSIKVSGDWLITSTSTGRGKLTAHRITGTEGFIDLYIGGGAIIDFELVVSDRHPFSNVKPSILLDDIFDSMEHNEIWLELENSYIQLGRTFCHTVDKIRQKISHSYGYEVRLVSDNHCSSTILKKISNKVSGPEIMELELSSPYCMILDFWTNSLTLGAVKVAPRKEMVIDNVSVNLRSMEVSMCSSLSFPLNGDPHTHIYTWHGSLFVVFSNTRNIMIHHNGKQSTQKTPIKKGIVLTVLFYAGFFFLGTDRGKLLMYKVQSPKECLDIVVYETPCQEITVCDEGIISIRIAESVHHKGKGPVIVCASSNDIYLVSATAWN